MEHINAPPPQPSTSFDPSTGLLSAKARELFEPILSHQVASDIQPIQPIITQPVFTQPAKAVDHLMLQSVSNLFASKIGSNENYSTGMRK